MSGWRNLVGVLVFLLLFAAAGWLDQRPAPVSLRPASAPAAPAAAPPERAELRLDLGGCLLPQSVIELTGPLEAPAVDDWQLAGAAGDRLQEDPCGNLWALWFNSWQVFEAGDPARLGQVALPRHGDVAALSRSGVASFLPGRGDLWVLSRQGDLARWDEQGWRRLPGLPGCGNGQLLRFDGDVWLACGAAAAQPLQRWDETQARWQSMRGELQAPQRLALDPLGQLWAVGAGEIARYTGAVERSWDIVGGHVGEVGTLAVDEQHWLLGNEAGLTVIERHGNTARQLFSGQAVTAVASDGDDGYWVALRNQGVRHVAGGRSHAWRYAEGLPDDEARDLLIDSRGRLWLAGTPMALIDARAAAQRIARLHAVEALPAEVFANGCDAAQALLGARPQSAELAQQTLGGRMLVFFAGRQICPDPWHAAAESPTFWRRPADGAVLEVGYNGLRGRRSCAGPCVGGQTAAIAELWRIVVHRAESLGVRARLQAYPIALPEPLPDESPGAAALLASNGDIWIATHESGLLQHDGDRWIRHRNEHGFDQDNPVRAITEDHTGAIWVASSPQWQSERGDYAGGSLHRWRAGEWQHWPPSAGVPAWAGQVVRALPGGVVLGGNGGLLEWRDQQVTTSAPAGRVHVAALSIDAGNYWWLAHGAAAEGISLRDGERWGSLDSRQGLFSDRILALAHDADGRIWLLSDDGRVAVYSRFLLMQRMRW